MLKIIDNLEIFFENCYRKVSIREYSRIIKKSPATCSKLLENYYKEGLLKRDKHLGYIFYYPDRESKLFLQLSNIYWEEKFKKFREYAEKTFLDPLIILFGSLSKAETTPDSDIDLAIISPEISPEIKKLDLNKFEKDLKRKIQLFPYASIDKIKNNELKNNIVNGLILKGEINIK